MNFFPLQPPQLCMFQTAKYNIILTCGDDCVTLNVSAEYSASNEMVSLYIDSEDGLMKDQLYIVVIEVVTATERFHYESQPGENETSLEFSK